jgi:oligopeptide/dipeptide ABC transporter ATP-binding protein
MDAVELRRIRGSSVSIVFQEASLALHPTIRIGEQVGEVLRAHGARSKRERGERAREILARVFPRDLDRIFSSYPHQLSGGQQQRALIAQAIACEPALVVADEPTASLDPTTQREILTLFQSLRDRLGIAFVLITHNPLLLAGLADRTLVLYAGKIAELGRTESVLFSPQHPYAQALLRCVPQFHNADTVAHRKTLLPVIQGASPNLAVLSPGFLFEPRCEQRMDSCKANDPMATVLENGHEVSCLRFCA